MNDKDALLKEHAVERFNELLDFFKERNATTYEDFQNASDRFRQGKNGTNSADVWFPFGCHTAYQVAMFLIASIIDNPEKSAKELGEQIIAM